METIRSNELGQKSPVDIARDEIMHGKMVEFFGDDYEKQDVLRKPAHYSQLEGIVVSTLANLNDRGLLTREPTEADVYSIQEDVMESWTPEAFIAEGGLISPEEHDVTHFDIRGIIAGTFSVSGRRGLIGERKIIPEEE